MRALTVFPAFCSSENPIAELAKSDDESRTRGWTFVRIVFSCVAVVENVPGEPRRSNTPRQTRAPHPRWVLIEKRRSEVEMQVFNPSSEDTEPVVGMALKRDTFGLDGCRHVLGDTVELAGGFLTISSAA